MSLVVSVTLGNGTDSFFEFIKNFLDIKSSIEFSSKSSLILIISVLYHVFFIVYCVGLFQLRRWTVIVTVVIVTKIVLEFFYQFFTSSSEQGDFSLLFIFALVWVIYSTIVAASSIFFRKYLFVPSRKLWLQVAIILLTIPAIVFLLLSIVFVDNKTVHDAHVLPMEQVTLSDDQNAYFALVLENSMTSSELVNFENAIALYEEVDLSKGFARQPELSAAIASTRRISDAFIAAAALSGMQCPVTYDADVRTISCELNTVRDTAIVVYLRVIDSYYQQDYKDMTRASIALVQFAHRYEQMTINFSSVEYLMSLIIRDMGYDALELAIIKINEAQQGGLIEKNLFDDLKNEIQAALELNRPNRNALINSVQSEYGFVKDMIFEIDLTRYSNYLWQPNKTLQEYANVISTTIDYYNQTCGSVEEKEKLQILYEVKNIHSKKLVYSYLLQPNAVGKILNSVMTSPLNEFKERYCTADKRHRELESLLLLI